jgi:hypothetical protein
MHLRTPWPSLHSFPKPQIFLTKFSAYFCYQILSTADKECGLCGKEFNYAPKKRISVRTGPFFTKILTTQQTIVGTSFVGFYKKWLKNRYITQQKFHLHTQATLRFQCASHHRLHICSQTLPWRTLEPIPPRKVSMFRMNV